MASAPVDTTTAVPKGRRSCPLCRQITRDGKWEVDATLAKFGLKNETYGCETRYVSCPECGEPYWYHFHEWLQDWQSESTFAFTRLDIAQARERLPEGERAAFDAGVPGMLAEMESDLSGGDGFLKSESAWRLSRYCNSAGKWESLERLMTHPDEAVFAGAFVQSFKKPEENDRPQPPPRFEPRTVPHSISGPALKRALKSADKEIKTLAAERTCESAIDSGDITALTEALLSRDSELARVSVWYLTYRSGERLDIKPLRKVLVGFVESGNEYQATCALKLLLRGRKDGADPEPPFEFVLDCLGHRNKGVRREAAEQIVYWAVSKNEKEIAVRRLAELLDDKDLGWTAMDRLKSWAEFGKKEVATAIPAVVPYVAAKKERWQTGMEVLRYAMEARMDVSAIYPFIAKGIAAGDRRVIESSSVILDQVLYRGIDLKKFRKDLEAGAHKAAFDSYGEQLAAILVRIYLRAKDWAALRKLLQHSNQNIPGFAAPALLKSGADIGPVVPVLAENLFDKVEFTRAQAAEALKRHARRSGDAAGAVRNALARALAGRDHAGVGVAEAKKLLETLVE